MVCFSMFSVSAGYAFTTIISCMKPRILYDTARHFRIAIYYCVSIQFWIPCISVNTCMPLFSAMKPYKVVPLLYYSCMWVNYIVFIAYVYSNST